MEAISVLDIFKIGVGPSSSHTMGPWRAAQRFLDSLRLRHQLPRTLRVRTDLYGSLAKTGVGHGTDLAVILGLSGEDPVTCEVAGLHDRVQRIITSGRLPLNGGAAIDFDRDADLRFHHDETLPFHANGIRFTALLDDGSRVSETYYSVGGGFVVQEDERPSGARAVRLPYPIERAEDLEHHCTATRLDIPGVVRRNERAWRTDADLDAALLEIWTAMLECIRRGCHTEGVLPGGLEVTRRAKRIHDRLMAPSAYGSAVPAANGPAGNSPDALAGPADAWLARVRASAHQDFSRTLRWVSTFALAVNEENAAFGRVVTAPTNGAAGVIPAVLMYHVAFGDSSPRSIIDFLLVSGQVGILFKKGATISAAMGGCQAEIGVSSAMAAAGLCQVMGGSIGQVLMAAEIAMEHHLGMTCDPIGGLVQVPCIERNTMGALKAITAANIALDSDPAAARVSLDDVIATMWATAQDMQTKYKETAEGGLAVHVSVGLSEC